MSTDRVIVIGAGVAGLTAALGLSTRGFDVTVCEQHQQPGGKMREVQIAGRSLDAGPTVFTMRWVLEEVFAAAGASLAEHVNLQPLDILARHAWSEHERLDLHADLERASDAIAAFAGPREARAYREFSARAQRIYRSLESAFIRAARPSTPFALMHRVGLAGLGELSRIAPFTTLARALGEHFRDPRLRQLFGRYATYCGSSPFLAPATLMLVAHVERTGVWLVEGGMHQLAVALARLALRRGATLRYGTAVAEVVLAHGRAAGVKLASGERLEADAVLVTADAAAVAGGYFGAEAARALPAASGAARSLSAITWNLLAKTAGFPLLHHNVFFSCDYPAEFDDIFLRNQPPAAPSVYVCAQDRASDELRPSESCERLLCLVNAPATGDHQPLNASEIAQCETRTFALLQRCGLQVERTPEMTIVTTPADFHRLFPGSGGALYGQSSHGWMASFRRPGARSRIPRLYLAGGSTHPGPGVPMAALSARQAVASLVADLTSRSPSRQAATLGGTSTP